MLKWPRIDTARLLEGWTRSIVRHPLLVVILSSLVVVASLFYTISHFRINTDLADMISDQLPYRKLEKDLQRAFPQLGSTIVVVIDAEIPEAASHVRDRMLEGLKKEASRFKRIYVPGGGEFFEKNGLLYMSLKELEELSDSLASAQPLLGFLSQDLSLRGLFSVLEKIVAQEVDAEGKKSLIPFFDRLSEAFEAAASGRPFQLSWQELIVGKDAAKAMSRQFIILEPLLDENSFSGGGPAIEAIRRIRNDLALDQAGSAKVRLTGDVALEYENLVAVRGSMGVTTLISFILVALALAVGLGSGRLVFASLLTLLVGLIWTLGFAIVFIGHLNLISVAFGVLFIGLGIDYGIQFCLRYRESIESGLDHHPAIVSTVKAIGVSLRLSTVGAAIGFYSFLPTAYTGVLELGLIAGTGMFINLFATLVLLPALLTLMPLKKDELKKFASGKTLYRIPYRHAKAICAGTLVIGGVAAFFVPKTSFDFNPLNLYDPKSETVSTTKELFKGEKTSPWTISVLARNAKEARETATRLGDLKEVKEAFILTDFVPQDQAPKMAILSDISLFMPPGLETPVLKNLSYDKKISSLNDFEGALKNSLSRLPKGRGEETGLRRLYGALESFKAALKVPETGKEALERLERSLLSNLPALFHSLTTSLQAHPFTESGLPPELRAQYVTSDGRYRVEVLPRENILNVDALNRFVKSVTAVAPNAIDTPVTIREAGKAVFHSFLQATLYALLAITIYLLIELRSLRDTGLILLPLLLSLLLTAAASVILDLPFNFANVIVIPLLLGSGVEGVYFIYRFRTEPPSSGNMLETSTARALFFSTLTTILSFSTLSFSPHRGMASMGKLLTLCIGFLMITTLVLLPALLSFLKNRPDGPIQNPLKKEGH